MPSFDLNNFTPSIQFLVTIGTLIVGSVAIIYSLIFVGGRVVTPQTIRTRLLTGIIAAFLVIALAALDIYLSVTPN
jgi:tellurite resistance protein TehA-like permease